MAALVTCQPDSKIHVIAHPGEAVDTKIDCYTKDTGLSQKKFGSALPRRFFYFSQDGHSMSVCSESCTSQQSVCGACGSFMRPCCAGLPPYFQVTKLGYDAEQMPLALRPRCPCCGCRLNPLDEFKFSEVKRDGCTFDPCSPFDSKLYSSYFESFALSAPTKSMSSCSDSQADYSPSCHLEAQMIPSAATSSQTAKRSTQSNCSHYCSRRKRCRY